MTNWKVYKIVKKETWPAQQEGWRSYIKFHLDRCIKLSGGGLFSEASYIECEMRSPFTSWWQDDYIEIDLDTLNYWGYFCDFKDTSAIRKLGSSNEIVPRNIISASGSSSDIIISPSAVNAMKSPRTMEIAREMSRMVDETGKNWEYKIEVENKDGKKISHSLICRKD